MKVSEQVKRFGLSHDIGRVTFTKWAVARMLAVRAKTTEYDVVQVWHFTYIDGSEYTMRIYLYG
jgi:hypothetical protein